MSTNISELLGFTKGTPLIPDVAEETPPQNDDEEVQPKPVTANMIKAVEVRMSPPPPPPPLPPFLSPAHAPIPPPHTLPKAAHTKEAWKPKRVTTFQPAMVAVNPNPQKDRQGHGFLSAQHPVLSYNDNRSKIFRPRGEVRPWPLCLKETNTNKTQHILTQHPNAKP